MEENIQQLEQTKKPINKKLISIATVICVIIGGLLWYFLYFIKTPEYSLNLVRESITKHDVDTFKKHVDLDSLLGNGYDDLMSAMIESDKKTTAAAKNWAAGFAQMMKPAIVSAFKDGALRYVETGKWEDNKQNNNNASNKPGLSSDKIVDKSGLNNSTFKGIAYTKKDGKTAIVGLKLFDSEIEKEIILDVKMRELDDGTWQIFQLSNFKEYIIDLEKTKTEILKKYIEDTEPIVDKHNQNINSFINEINTINTYNISVDEKNTRIKSILQDKMLNDWNERINELSQIKVPTAAKELSDIRLNLSELRKQHIQINIEWIDSRTEELLNEADKIYNQANELDLKIKAIKNKVE